MGFQVTASRHHSLALLKRVVIVNRKRCLGTVQSGRRLHVVSSRESYERRRPSTCNFLRRDCCNKLNFEREICQQTSRLSRIPPEPDAHRLWIFGQAISLANCPTVSLLRVQQMTSSMQLIEAFGGGWDLSQLSTECQVPGEAPVTNCGRHAR